MKTPHQPPQPELPSYTHKHLQETSLTIHIKPIPPELTLPQIPLSQLTKTQLKPSGSEPPLQFTQTISPETQADPETQANPDIKIMPESVAEDIINLFPHSSDLVFDIRPLISLPAQPGASNPKPTISSKPTIPSHPRTTNSAPSSPTKEAEPKEGNLIPRRRNQPTKDDSLLIRRAP